VVWIGWGSNCFFKGWRAISDIKGLKKGGSNDGTMDSDAPCGAILLSIWNGIIRNFGYGIDYAQSGNELEQQ
jgi:hypothetical protein